MRILCIFIAFGLNNVLLSGQQKYDPDSILKAIPTLPDTQKIRAYYDITRAWVGVEKEKSLDAAKKALEISENLKNDVWIARSLNVLVAVLNIHSEHQTALPLVTRALQLASKSGHRMQMLESLENLAGLHASLRHWEEAVEYALKGLNQAREMNDTVGILNTTNTLGNAYLEMRHYQEAEQSFNEGLVLARSTGRLFELGRAYFNLALLYERRQSWEEAIQFASEGAKAFREFNYPVGEVQNLLIVARAHYEMGELEHADSISRQLLKMMEEVGSPLLEGEIYLQMGMVELEQGFLSQATEHFLLAEKKGVEIPDLKLQKEALYYLEKIFSIQSDFNTAKKYRQQYESASDSLLTQITSERLASTLSLFELQKKDAEILRLQNENLKDSVWQRNILCIAILLVLASIPGFVFWSRHRYREQRAKAEMEKERADQFARLDLLKDQFLANTSHELRTPLNGIIGIADSLINGAAGKLPEKAEWNLELITNSAKRLSHLINDILDFSKIKSDEISLKRAPVDLHSAVDVVMNLCLPLLRDRPVDIFNRVPADLPLVFADESRLEQILHNLIGNAIKFTETGEISLEAFENKGEVVMKIKDTGVGIPANKLEDIFRPFEQLNGTDIREYGGTGLGLSITKKLVELHEGKIWVESEQGEGSVFYFSIPVSKVQEKTSTIKNQGKIIQKKEILSVLETQSGSLSVKEPFSILVADDELINRQVLENQLSMAGYSVKQAVNGQEVLQLINNGEHFDLIILDIMMPKMSGYEVCRKLREKYPTNELPVVMLTAKDRVLDLVEGFDVGANDYLIKPFSRDELLSRIRTHLNLNQIHKATGRFVPYEFLRSVGRESITDVRLGDFTHKEVTVFFSDIRNYTTLAEQMTPEENFRFVNDYVGLMGPIISSHQGFVHQYLGDGIMAIFPKPPDDALDASIAMLRELMNQSKKSGRLPLEIGIGVHTGPLVMGIIGDARRTEPATISDTVNAASRMETLTKFYGANIIISEDGIRQLHAPHRFHLRYLGKIQVKGRKMPLGTYECFDGDAPEVLEAKLKSLPDFQEGLALFYTREFAQATAIFDQILKKSAQDKVAQYFRNKAARFIVEGIPADWTGVEIQS